MINAAGLIWEERLEGSCKDAQNSWSHSLSLGPKDAVARRLYSFAAFANHESGSYATLLEPREAEMIALALAWDSRQRQDQNRAIYWYEQAMSFAARLSTVESLVPLYLASGDKSKIGQAWQRAAEFLPDTDPDHWWAVGQIAELMEDWKGASAAYENGAKLAKSPYFYLMKLGGVRQRFNPGLAESTYWTALELRPDLIWAYLGLGHIRFNSGDLSGAQAFYLEAERLSPNDLNPKFFLGYLNILQGNYTESCEYFKKVMKIEPNHQPTLNCLSQLKSCKP